MIRIFRSLFYSIVGMASLSWISVSLIILCFAGPDPDGRLVAFVEERLISEEIETSGWTFSELSSFFFNLLGLMNVTLLSTTIVAGLVWSAASHYLNIDSPGKAKIYFIHWVVFSGIFVVTVLGISFFFTSSTTYEAAQYISTQGTTILMFLSAIFYFLTYYIGVILGTARFARSSVLFANKLPGNL